LPQLEARLRSKEQVEQSAGAYLKDMGAFEAETKVRGAVLSGG
jgi:hypothetical protein